MDRAGYHQLRHSAHRKKIKVEYINKGSTRDIHGTGFNFFISNQDKFEAEIDALGLEDISHDCVLKKHDKDRMKMKVAMT
jgi:hypothetical protein